MNGNILTQNSWKVTVVFTLTVLFATTCLFLTNLSAQQVEGDPNMRWNGRWELNNEVWVEASVCVGYYAPSLKSSHCIYVWNSSTQHEVKCYYEFDAKVTGPGLDDDDDDFHENEIGEGVAPTRDSWSKSGAFSFDMSDEEEGIFTITAFTDIEVKRKNGAETGGFRVTIPREFHIP